MKILCDNDQYVIGYLSEPTECPTPRANSKANYGLRVIMVGPLGSSLGKKKNTILVRDVGDGGVCAGMG